jgi:hypothetical protein
VLAVAAIGGAFTLLIRRSPPFSERRSSAQGLNIAIGKQDLTGIYDARGFSGVIGSRRQDRQRVVQKKRVARWMNPSGDGNSRL